MLKHYEQAVGEGVWGEVWIERRPTLAEWRPVPVDVARADLSRGGA